MAREIMATPAVQHAYQAILEARGLTSAGLDAIHAVHLSRHSSVDGGDRDRSLRALALARKYVTPRGPVAALGSVADEVLAAMTTEELEAFVERKVWPARFRERLCPTVAPGAGDTRWHHQKQEPAPAPRDDDPNTHRRHAPREDRLEPEPVTTPEPRPSNLAAAGEEWRHDVATAEAQLREAQRLAGGDPRWRDLATRDRKW